MLAESKSPHRSAHKPTVAEHETVRSQPLSHLSVPPIVVNSEHSGDETIPQDITIKSQGSGKFSNIRKKMLQFFGASGDKEAIHQSLQNLSLSPINQRVPNFSSTGNNMQDITTNPMRSSYVTNDVPTDISQIKEEYTNSLIAVTSLTDMEIRAVQNSWLLLKAHIEKIGVIVFLGVFEEHSDFRDAFARFRGKQLKDITRDPTLQAHGLRVLNIVEKVISRLQKVESIHDFVLPLGSRHCNYVPSIKLIPCVGEQLFEAIRPVLEEQDAWNESTETGWKTVLTFLTNSMRYGLARTPQKSLSSI